MDDPSFFANPWVLAALAALAVVALSWFALRRSARRPGGEGGWAARENDLQNLGLSEVRPRGAEPPRPAGAPAAADEPVSAPRPSLPSTRSAPAPRAAAPVALAAEGPPEEEADGLEGVFGPPTPAGARGGAAEAKAPPEPAAPEGPRPRPAREGARGGPPGVAALLDSIRAALDARGVALLHHNAADHFEVVARAGEGFGGPPAFPAALNALAGVPADGTVAHLEGDALAGLRYHARPSATVGQAVALAVPAAEGRHLLVIDRGVDDEPFAEAHLALLGHYTDLLARLLGAAPGAFPPPAARPAGDAPALAAGAAGAAGADEADETPAAPVVPQRRAILAQEMAAARAAAHPLSFALVVHREPDLGGEDGPDPAALEDALRRQLEDTDGTTRVERFGELLLGAFAHLGAAEAEAWADRVSAAGAPVHIGIAVLSDRHDDPDALRADAAAALQEAYERDEACVILE